MLFRKALIIFMVASFSLCSCVTLRPKPESVTLKEMEYKHEKEKRDQEETMTYGETAFVVGLSILKGLILEE